MGVSGKQWRATIGSWNRDHVRSPCTSYRVGDEVDSACSLAVPLLLLAALLLIGGVEWNPGPKNDTETLPGSNTDPTPLTPEDKALTELKKRHSSEMEEMKRKMEVHEKERSKLEQQLLEQSKRLEELTNHLLEQRSALHLGIEQQIEEIKPAPDSEVVSDSVANSSQEDKPKNYKKTAGRDTMAGALFEVKMVSLIFIRALNSHQPFLLASNMEAAGSFDDIIVRIKLADEDSWSTILIQMKHKDSGRVGYAPLLSLSGKSAFGMVRYCNSFINVKKEFYSDKSDWETDWKFDEFKFVLYTNSQSDEDVNEQEKGVKVSMNKLLASNTKGPAFHFSKTSPIYQYMKEMVELKNLLEDILTSLNDQTTHEEVENTIKTQVSKFQLSTHIKELEAKKSKLMSEPTKKKLQSSLKELSLVQDLESYEFFFKCFYLYTGQSNEGQLDSLISQEIKHAFRISNNAEVAALKTLLVDSVSKWWSDKIHSGSWLTEHSFVWRSVVACRIGQLSLPKLTELTTEIVRYESKSSERLVKTVYEDGGSRKVNILVKKGTNSLIASQVYQALTEINRAHFHIFTGARELLRRKGEMIEVWKNSLCLGLVIDCDHPLNEVETDHLATTLLDAITSPKILTIVLISNKHDSLSRALQPVLLQSHEVCQWSDFNLESQNELLKRPVIFQGETLPLSALVGGDVSLINQQLQGSALAKVLNTDLTVGQPLEPLIPYYLPRRLIRDSKEVNITSLTDVPERVVVLISKPGMGKTTLVSHLARAAKLADPTTWVVRVMLNDCTAYMARLKPDQINTASAIDFLTHFAQETDSAVERMLFKNRLLFSGNVIAFIDSVDEVCPFYEETVCVILKQLLGTKIKSVWVTSRQIAKVSLEKALNVRSFSLVSFSPGDQISFFQKFWKDRHANASVFLDDFIGRVMQLSIDGINGGSLAYSIPQQTRMLAEYFDPQLDYYLETGLLNLPHRINLLQLFESFVEKKLNIYFEEKRKDDETNAAIKTDKEALTQLILDNHMQAALMVLLSDVEFSVLTSYDRLDKQVSNSLLKTGIIERVIHGKPYFIHRTFAEYFTSLWISANYSTKQICLRKALLQPRFQVVRTFLDLKLSVNCKLHQAVINRDIRLVKSTLSSGTNINLTDEAGRTALHLAAANCGTDNNQDYVDIVRELLKHEADITLQGMLLQWRPLQYAVGARSWTVVGLLLQAKGLREDLEEAKQIIKAEVFDDFVTFLSNCNFSPTGLMILSSRHGDLGVVKYLVEKCGVDIACRGVDGSTPMHKSAEGGHIDVMQFLFERNAPCDVLDETDSLPVHYASSVAVVELLVQHGSSVSACNKQGDSPLASALKTTNVDGAKYLLQHGADLDSVNLHNDYPYWADYKTGLLNVEEFFVRLEEVRLDIAVRKEQALREEQEGQVRLEEQGRNDNRSQFEKQAELDEQTRLMKHGNELLFQAVRDNSLDDVRYLVSKGVQLSERTKEGESLLHVATQKGNQVVIQYLIERAADLKISDTEWKPLLFLASEFGSVDVIKYLHDLDADLAATDDRGWSSLHIASMHSKIEVIKYLHTHGADVVMTDHDGWSPLHFASAFGTIDVVKYLHGLGADPKALNKARRRPVNVAGKWGNNADQRQAIVEYLNPYSIIQQP